MMAEEGCALGGHETKNVVCCAKHHLEVPCSSCMDVEKPVKEVVKKVDEKETDQQIGIQ
jgi:hypothetical protein